MSNDTQYGRFLTVSDIKKLTDPKTTSKMLATGKELYGAKAFNDFMGTIPAKLNALIESYRNSGNDKAADELSGILLQFLNERGPEKEGIPSDNTITALRSYGLLMPKFRSESLKNDLKDRMEYEDEYPIDAEARVYKERVGHPEWSNKELYTYLTGKDSRGNYTADSATRADASKPYETNYGSAPFTTRLGNTNKRRDEEYESTLTSILHKYAGMLPGLSVPKGVMNEGLNSGLSLRGEGEGADVSQWPTLRDELLDLGLTIGLPAAKAGGTIRNAAKGTGALERLYKYTNPSKLDKALNITGEVGKYANPVVQGAAGGYLTSQSEGDNNQHMGADMLTGAVSGGLLNFAPNLYSNFTGKAKGPVKFDNLQGAEKYLYNAGKQAKLYNDNKLKKDIMDLSGDRKKAMLDWDLALKADKDFPVSKAGKIAPGSENGSDITIFGEPGGMETSDAINAAVSYITKSKGSEKYPMASGEYQLATDLANKGYKSLSPDEGMGSLGKFRNLVSTGQGFNAAMANELNRAFKLTPESINSMTPEVRAELEVYLGKLAESRWLKNTPEIRKALMDEAISTWNFHGKETSPKYTIIGGGAPDLVDETTYRMPHEAFREVAHQPTPVRTNLKRMGTNTAINAGFSGSGKTSAAGVESSSEAPDSGQDIYEKYLYPYTGADERSGVSYNDVEDALRSKAPSYLRRRYKSEQGDVWPFLIPYTEAQQ